jgi:steroid Delta-isomerase
VSGDKALALSTDARTLRVIGFYQGLSRQRLDSLAEVYSVDARFVDPFNDVSGLDAVHRVFEHMFDTLHAPAFRVLASITEGPQCFLLWDFSFSRSAGGPVTVLRGGSHLQYAPDGRVQSHVDHWDPARQLYETVPLLGTVMRWLRRRLGTPGTAARAGAQQRT